eukprot:8373806-Pyramimonas_sp.AAC.1
MCCNAQGILRSGEDAKGGPPTRPHPLANTTTTHPRRRARRLLLVLPAEYSLYPSAIGTRYGYILSPLLRLVPATGIFSRPVCDWYPLRVFSLSLTAGGWSSQPPRGSGLEGV